MSVVSFILGIPAFLEWLIFYIPIKRTKAQERSGLYCRALEDRDYVSAESDDERSPVRVV